ncbi:hypothetical protein [Arcanobacterium canis]
MSTPTDPYNSTKGTPAEDTFLEPLEEEIPAGDLHFSNPASQKATSGEAPAEPLAPLPAHSKFERHAWDNAANDDLPTHDEPQYMTEEHSSSSDAHPVNFSDADVPADDHAVTRTSVISAANMEFAPLREFESEETSPFTASEFESTPARHDEWRHAPETLPVAADADPETTPQPSSVLEPKKSRGWAHVGSFFVVLLLLPVAWYLLEDSAARLQTSALSDAATLNTLGLAELTGAFATLALLWMNIRKSALGAIFWGTLVAIAGVVGVCMPSLVKQLTDAIADPFGTYNAFTGNVVYHVTNSSVNGHLALCGFAVMITGIVVHHTRPHKAGSTQMDFVGE